VFRILIRLAYLYLRHIIWKSFICSKISRDYFHEIIIE